MAVKQPEPAFVLAEPFAERIERLLRELRLAIKFKRPAILFAVYRSDLVRAEADAKLAYKLTDLGQRIVRIQVSQTVYDVPAMLADYPNRENTVFFVRNLRWGENEGREAYRALNIRREYFVDERLHVVFWLTETELRDLAIFATDFWAFRHRTVEFFDRVQPDHIARHAGKLTWEEWGDGLFDKDTAAKIELREKLLAELPAGNETAYQRAELLYALTPLYLANKDFERALAATNQALAIAVQLADQRLQARYYYNRGLTYTNLGQFDDALADYGRAIQLDFADAKAYNNRGLTYTNLGQFNDALADYSRAIKLDPAYVDAYYNRGNTYQNLGQFEAALADYDRAIQLDPAYAKAYNNRSLTYQKLGQFEAALADYGRAIQLVPADAKAYNNRGIIYKNLGQFEEALADYSRAIQLDPVDAKTYNNRGNIYAELGQFEDALADYSRAIQLDPANAKAYNNRGNTYKNLGQFEDALADYSRAIQLDPANATAYNNRGNTSHKLGQLEDALADYGCVLQLDPTDAKAYNNRGITYHNLGQFEDALADYSRAIHLNPPYAKTHHNRGNTYHKLGQFEAALADYGRAIQLDPTDASAYAAIALIYKKLGNEAAYKKYIKQALVLQDKTSLYSQACIAAIARVDEEALLLLEQALANQEINHEHVRADPNFESLRDNPRFQVLVEGD